jgi:hypothetical protein
MQLLVNLSKQKDYIKYQRAAELAKLSGYKYELLAMGIMRYNRSHLSQREMRSTRLNVQAESRIHTEFRSLRLFKKKVLL